MAATKIAICTTNRQKYRLCLVKHKRMPDFQESSSCCNPNQHRAASGHLCTAPLQLKHCPNSSFWWAIKASGFCNLKQQQGKWIAETKLFHQNFSISEQHLTLRNCLLKISTAGLWIPEHFHTVHREGITWPQPAGACALLTESVLTQGYSIRCGFALPEWTGVTVREQQQCHALAAGRDTGVFLLRATLLGLATGTSGSMSRAFGGRAHGNGSPRTWCRSSSGCLGWLVSLELHQTVLHLCTDRKTDLTTPAVFEADSYLYFSSAHPKTSDSYICWVSRSREMFFPQPLP